MPEPILKGAGVKAGVGQRKAEGVPSMWRNGLISLLSIASAPVARTAGPYKRAKIRYENAAALAAQCD